MLVNDLVGSRISKKYPETLFHMLQNKITLNRSYKATASENSDKPSTRVIHFNQSSKGFANNSISTSKYTLLNFFFKFILEQFSKYANMFFLLISILQQIGSLSPTSKYTTIGPLLFILFIAAIKEVIEDSKRHKSDSEVNKRMVQVLVDGKFVEKKWLDLIVGDVVKIDNGGYFPADIIVLSTSEPDGLCYVETSNLDGETNLKIKQCRPETLNWLTAEHLANVSGFIECELPNNSLYTFDGTFKFKNPDNVPIGGKIENNGEITSNDGHTNPRRSTLDRSRPTANKDGQLEVPLSPEQMLLRGCQLRNTRWIQGICIFTGHETKLMRNGTAAPIKRTDVERKTNRQIVFLFILMIFMSFFSSAGLLINISGNLNSENDDSRWYLSITNQKPADFATNFFLQFLTFLILYNTLIPISLIVTMEIVKAVTSYLINCDKDMYYPPAKSFAICRTSSLVEELGQIKYIFSDKTGTLTCNIMEFRQCCIANKCYSDVIHKDKAGLEVHSFDTLHKDLEGPNQPYIHEFLLLLSACHTVIPELPDNYNDDINTIIYQASSPDENALVKGARLLKYVFLTRKPKCIQISIHNEIKEFQILQVNEFNSTRKRMSVVVRQPNNKIVLYVKGADTVIYERLSANNPFVAITNQALSEYANEGLRTLCLAMREISQEEYTQWNKIYEKASTTLNNRPQELDNAAEIIERDLFLLGATAIEDKLQDGVPDTIFNLANAGIRIWVLTGDRQETAINIGFSCKLLNNDMDLMTFDQEKPELFKAHLLEQLERCKDRKMQVFASEKKQTNWIGKLLEFFSGKSSISHDELDMTKTPLGLVITGKTLGFALQPENELMFLRLACLCKSVICCRVSPLQKALVVKLVKKHLKTLTLAIGDGANDVSMIQAAHVGIGINGLEGSQAARASDVAIGQFRFLQKLLLVHGSWAYNRISKLILYCFYKNIALQFTQFWYSFNNGFTGQTIYESWSLAAYNLFFTACQPLYIGIFEQFVNKQNLLKYTQLYKIGQNQEFFNASAFWAIALNGIYHSVICYFSIFFIMGSNYFGVSGGISGLNDGLWFVGMTLYTVILTVVTGKAALLTTWWTIWAYFAIFGSLLVWIIFLPIFSAVGPTLNMGVELYGMAGQLYGSGVFWTCCIIVPALALSRDVAWKL
eukprot:NODE_251_length_12882_cov_0.075334.p1 type:complete len:1159 gc:universal NODE_251_length_12882_cov_0.075334:2349-5825(+)